jgi:hypothetical protein
MTMVKSLMTIKCPLSAGRFDGHGSPPVQYEAHLPMEHVQGYTRSHWMLPSDNYSLHIAPAAARATANKKQCNYGPTLLAILTAAEVRWYNTACIAQRRRCRALVEATGCHHWASIAADSCNWSCICLFFSSFFIINL